MNSYFIKPTHLYFYLLCLFHLGTIITGMTFTSRMIHVLYSEHTIIITGGVFFIPIVFFIQDIVTEIYGYDNARKMLNLNLILFVMYTMLFWLFSIIPSHHQSASFQNFQQIAITLPRHACSFVISLAIGGKINNYILWKLKLISNQRFLALRFISSTAIGEAFFQLVAIFISWYGVFPSKEIWFIALAAYIYKVFFEVLITPVNIFICRYLKSLKMKELEYVF